MGRGYNALAAVGLLVGLGAVIGVPAAISAALPDEEPLPPGERLDVGSGVTLIPPPDARQLIDDSRPGGDEVSLVLDGITVTIKSVEVPERTADFIAHTRRKFSRDDSLTPGPAAPWRLASGVLGERGDLRDEHDLDIDPGCYGIAVAEQLAAVVTISPVAGCAAVPATIWTAADSLTFDPQDAP